MEYGMMSSRFTVGSPMLNAFPLFTGLIENFVQIQGNELAAFYQPFSMISKSGFTVENSIQNERINLHELKL
jgi:hypothetical protein